MTDGGGWRILSHPLFLDQVERLTRQVAAERARNPTTYQSTAPAKVLAAIEKLALIVIPSDPTRPEYRQGDTLGAAYKHWFRAKFGNGRYRLFFRYSLKARLILLVWVNDERSLRAYDAKDDAYAVFRRMLGSGNPPDDWNSLVAECVAVDALVRLSSAFGPAADENHP